MFALCVLHRRFLLILLLTIIFILPQILQNLFRVENRKGRAASRVPGTPLAPPMAKLPTNHRWGIPELRVGGAGPGGFALEAAVKDTRVAVIRRD